MRFGNWPFPCRLAAAATVLGLTLCARTAVGQVSPVLVIVPPPATNTVSFNNLTGANGDPFSTYTEGSFTIANNAGSWFKAFVYGNPTPDIFDGPGQNPGIGVLRVTDSAGLFTFVGFDYSSNNGNSGYEIEGFLGVNRVFDETGTLLTPNFNPYASLNPTSNIDALLIHIFPGAGATSINIDNLRVTTVPEPASLALLAACFAGAIGWQRLVRKTCNGR
jgi:hypothetical protein